MLVQIGQLLAFQRWTSAQIGLLRSNRCLSVFVPGLQESLADNLVNHSVAITRRIAVNNAVIGSEEIVKMSDGWRDDFNGTTMVYRLSPDEDPYFFAM